MGADRKRWGTQKQVGVILICSIGLTVFYSYLDIGPRDTYRVERPYSYSYHITNNFSYYLVDGPHCKIPNLDPHHWSVRKFVQSRSYASCRNYLPHLVTLRRSVAPLETRLHIDRRAAKKYFPGDVTCCYQRIDRLDESDDKISKGKEICFKNSTTLSNTTEMVTVTCSKYFKTVKLRRKGNVLYETMFYIIVLTEAVKAKMKSQEENRKLNIDNSVADNIANKGDLPQVSNKLDERVVKSERTKIGFDRSKIKQNASLPRKYKPKENAEQNINQLPDGSNDLKENIADELKRRDFKDKFRENQGDTVTSDDLSILIIGIDSISRLNLIRAMPRTREFLDQQGWFELEGYNKVADNTLPNLMPLLSGYSIGEVEMSCNLNQKGFFDSCPMIWKDLSTKGYITSYAEDLAAISTFNYHRKGFRQQPTDYYWRPLLQAGEGMFKQKTMDNIARYCVGSSLEAELLMDYTHQFVNQFQNHSYFNFVWMNAFSHNDVNSPSRMDKKVYQFLSGLNYTALRNTAIIFLSDHGIRFGPIRTTYSGWFEERLPFIFVHLPTWYQEKYPDKINNLRANKNRLTNPYDVYDTLNELTGLGNRSQSENSSSLLEPVDLNRACSDIRIPEHWCTCTEMINLAQDDPRATDLGRVVVRHIDSLLSKHPDSVKPGFRCADLNLTKVYSVQTNKNPIKTEKEASEMFIVQVETAPSNALFEATVVMRAHTFHVTGDVSRLNMYRDEGACLKDNELRLFCFCEPMEQIH